MEDVQIASRNKATVRDALRELMLRECDEDIQAAFGQHYYTLEPLLMQLIRELRKARHGD